MRKIFLMVILLLFQANNLHAELILLKDGRITFETPDGFEEMAKEQILKKFARANPPDKAYSNKNMGTSVSIIFSPASVRVDQLNSLKTALERTLPRSIPNLVWIRKEIIMNNGIKWIHFEMTGTAIDADIHSNMYITSFDDRMLGFNFHSTKEQYQDYSEELKNSFESIEIQ